MVPGPDLNIGYRELIYRYFNKFVIIYSTTCSTSPCRLKMNGQVILIFKDIMPDFFNQYTYFQSVVADSTLMLRNS